MKTLKTLLAATLLAGINQMTVHADTAAITGPSAGSVRDDYPNAVGYAFSLNSDQTLSSLGILDVANPPAGTAVSGTAPGEGPYTEEVGIFSVPATGVGTLLASAEVTVPGTTADFGQFDFSSSLTYATGSSLTLTAGTVYSIVAEIDKSGFLQLAPLSAAPGVNVLGNAYSNTSVFGPPDVIGLGNVGEGYLGPNFTFSAPAVPEPATYALMLGGLGLLLVFARRRNA